MNAWVPEDTFAARLVLARRQLGLRQREAALRCGLSSATWAAWELGKLPRNMADVVKTISDALGVDREWLMWGGALSPAGSVDVTESELRRAGTRWSPPWVEQPSLFDESSDPRDWELVADLTGPEMTAYMRRSATAQAAA